MGFTVSLTTQENHTMNTIFIGIAIGQRFEFGGTAWVKKSSRSATLEENPTKWFYFSAKDRVRILGKA
jgi:predicted transcriptional regulator